MKRLLGSPFMQMLIGRAIGLYMHFVGLTTRWRDVNRAAVERVWAEGGPVIACIWHNRFMLVHKMWGFGPGFQTAKMLISQSREGGVVTHASKTVGADVIRGSSAKGGQSKGGLGALREMLRHLSHNGCICLTPDGPRGPRMRAKMSPIQLAKMSGAPIIALAWSSNRRKTFQSWDRFLLPLPFGRGARVWSEPIRVAKDADEAAMEDARAQLEAELNRISAEADRLAGAPVIEPDARPARVESPAPAA